MNEKLRELLEAASAESNNPKIQELTTYLISLSDDYDYMDWNDWIDYKNSPDFEIDIQNLIDILRET